MGFFFAQNLKKTAAPRASVPLRRSRGFRHGGHLRRGHQNPVQPVALGHLPTFIGQLTRPLPLARHNGRFISATIATGHNAKADRLSRPLQLHEMPIRFRHGLFLC